MFYQFIMSQQLFLNNYELEKQFPIVPWGLLSNDLYLVICYKINCTPVSHVSHVLQPGI